MTHSDMHSIVNYLKQLFGRGKIMNSYSIQFNSIQKIICIALHYRKSITGGLAQFSINLDMHLWTGVILI